MSGRRVQPGITYKNNNGCTLIATIMSVDNSNATKEGLCLKGVCEIKLPDYDLAFLQYGGALNALTSDGRSELSISGCSESIDLKEGAFSIKLSTDEKHMFMKDGVLHVPSNASMRVITSPVIVDAMMTIGEKVVGDSIERLIEGLVKRHSVHTLVYRTWTAPYGTILLSNLRIELDGVPVNVQEYKSEIDVGLSQPLMISYNQEAGARRQVLHLEETDGLSKPVTYTPLGYMPLRHILRNKTGLTDKGLESWLDAAVRTIVKDDALVEQMYKAFEKPKTEVDNQAAHVAVNAITTIMYSQTSYAYDGHEVITPQGVEFVGAEAWNENSPRSVQACGDCDDSAMFGMWVCYHLHIGAQGANSVSTPSTGPAGTFVKNALFHYEPMLAVTLAMAGSGGELNDKPQLAGHATILFLPTTHVLEGLERSNDIGETMTSQFEHFYPHTKQMALGQKWTVKEAVEALHMAEPFVAEGTILSDARVFHKNREDRNKASLQTLSQKRKLQSIGNMLASSYIDLTTNSKTHKHHFYLKWIEGNVMKPLQIGDKYTSQLVFVRYPFKQTGTRIDSGTTPEELVEQQYALAPLAYEEQANHKVLEAIFEEFKHHRMADRVERPLTEEQSQIIKRNLVRMDQFMGMLNALPSEPPPNLTRIDLLFPPRVLMGNDASVEDTLSKFKDVKAGYARRFPLDSNLGKLTDGSTGAFMHCATVYMH